MDHSILGRLFFFSLPSPEDTFLLTLLPPPPFPFSLLNRKSQDMEPWELSEVICLVRQEFRAATAQWVVFGTGRQQQAINCMGLPQSSLFLCKVNL